MSNHTSDDGKSARRVNGIRGASERVAPREEPFRNYGGWSCPRCESTNTIIEGYDTGPEGYCMSCARTIPIPAEHLKRYERANAPH